MRILFTRFPLESVYGGAEVQTLSLMNGLRERGHEAGFLGSCPVLLEKAASFHLPVSSLDIGKPPVTKWGVASFLWRQRAMRKKLIEFFLPPHPPPERSDRSDRAGNPLPLLRQGSGGQARGEGTVICMLSLSEKLLITKWAVENGMKVFWIEHDRVGRWLRWNPWLPRLRRLSWLATTVVVSDLSKRMYVERGWDPERIVVIPNGIDLRKLGTRGWELGAGNTTKPPMSVPGPRPQAPFLRIGAIARLSPEKGVDLLIEAVKDLPNIHLTIVGTGRDEAYIRQRIQRGTPAPEPSSVRGAARNEERVTIVSSVPDVATFYRSLDLFVLPSRDHDPCPLAPMEAMACGTPVIMTDACGTAEYVENGKEAIVVSAGSVEALRAAILEATSDERRAGLSRCGLEAARKKFSLERMVGEYERAFHFFPSRPSQRERGEHIWHTAFHVLRCLAAACAAGSPRVPSPLHPLERRKNA